MFQSGERNDRRAGRAWRWAVALFACLCPAGCALIDAHAPGATSLPADSQGIDFARFVPALLPNVSAKPEPAVDKADVVVESSLDSKANKAAAPPMGASKTPEPPAASAKAEGETLPPPRAAPVPLTLDRAINVTLLADPKIRMGFEAINQANSDRLTAWLPPNPTLYMDAQLLPLTRPFVVTDQGGPPQADFQLGYQIDWLLFGNACGAMAERQPRRQGERADYADKIRLRVTETAVAFYDVLEAKGLLKLAQQDIDNFKRMEDATRRAVEAGGRPNVDLSRVRLDLLSSQPRLSRRRIRMRTGYRQSRICAPCWVDPTPTRISKWRAT